MPIAGHLACCKWRSLIYSRAMKVSGIGRVIFWGGGSLWIGRAVAPADFHSHHAAQLAIGFDGPVEFRGRGDGEWTSAGAILVAPGFAHSFRAPERQVANLLFEPETRTARALMDRFGNGALAQIPDALVTDAVAPLRALFAADATDAALAAEAIAVIGRLAGTIEPSRQTDQRILKAMDWIGSNLSEPLTLSGAAAVAGLSESRFRHVFVQETGMAFRPYVLWARLNHALELGFAGESWTDAAHAANFADQSHLTRTCRRMLGLVPTSLRITAFTAAR